MEQSNGYITVVSHLGKGSTFTIHFPRITEDAVLEALGRFSEDLTALQRMIRRGDGDGLFSLFARTRAIRRGIVEMGQETAAPDFGRRKGEDDNGAS